MKVYDGADEVSTETQRKDRVKVGIAEYGVTTDGADLTTSGLGSCLGISMYDNQVGVAGLVHVMLPTTEEVDSSNDAKFVDTGVSLLIEEMEAAGADVDHLEAKIAGGSDMLDFSENGSSIGSRNVEKVESTFADLDIPIVGRDVGGDHGRSIRFDGDSGDMIVKSAHVGERTI